MDAALNAFLITIAIMGGLISPLLIVAFFGAVGNSMKALAAGLEAKVEEVKKQPPFDDVELNLNPATRILSGRIIKDNNVVWQGSVRRQQDDL